MIRTFSSSDLWHWLHPHSEPHDALALSSSTTGEAVRIQRPSSIRLDRGHEELDQISSRLHTSLRIARASPSNSDASSTGSSPDLMTTHLPSSPHSARHKTSPPAMPKRKNEKSVQMRKMLEDETTKARFRKFLALTHAEENVDFYDACLNLSAQQSLEARVASAREAIERFILDSAPAQVCLSSKTRDSLVNAYQTNMADETLLLLFKPALNELFRDLRLSQAFKDFEAVERTAAIDMAKASAAKAAAEHEAAAAAAATTTGDDVVPVTI